MTDRLFLGYTMAVAVGLVAACFRWLPPRATRWVVTGLVAWLGWVGFLGSSGMLADTALRPPAVLYMVGPMFIFGLLLAVTRFGAHFALAFPLPLLLGAQSFRIGVEWLLHRLWQETLAPRMLTWEGANFDILIGVTAALAAWAVTRGRGGAWFALAWSFAGIAMLANVVVRAALTAPGGLNLITTEVVNRLPGLFPYSYLAGFLAPLALVLHILAIRALFWRLAPSIPKSAG